jgi:hypothetical protein
MMEGGKRGEGELDLCECLTPLEDLTRATMMTTMLRVPQTTMTAIGM